MGSDDHHREANKKLVRRGIREIAGEGNYERIDDFYAEDFVQRGGAKGPFEGREQFQDHLESLHRAFPDLSATVDCCICEGNRVAARTIYRGTHEGTFLGIEPTETTIEVSRTVLYRIEDGLIVEAWADPYIFHVLRQLDALPEVLCD